MPTEEENQTRIGIVRSSYISQLLMYQWLWKKFSEKWGNTPLNVAIIPEMTATVKSIMDKVEEYNKAVDEKEEENTVRGISADVIAVDECKEISLEDLEKELKDGEKEEENILIIPNGDWHIGERDTDSWWRQSEMEQNPSPPPVPPPEAFTSAGVVVHENAERWNDGVGDSPREVGRQMHEAMEQNGEVIRQHNRAIRGTPNRTLRNRLLSQAHGGSIFLAHQRRSICWSCQRVGCSRTRCEKTTRDGECAGHLVKPPEKKYFCVICESRLDSPEYFPDGFPDKWKACCYCIEVWNEMNGIPCNLIGMGASEIRERWEDLKEKFEEVFTL